jgi:hypothetical protein
MVNLHISHFDCAEGPATTEDRDKAEDDTVQALLWMARQVAAQHIRRGQRACIVRCAGSQDTRIEGDTLAMLAMSQRDFVLVEDDRRELDYLNNAAEYLSRPGGDYCAFRKRALALQVVRNAVALTVSVGQERTLPEVIQALLRLDDLTLLLARARRAEAELAELQSPDIPF